MRIEVELFATLASYLPPSSSAGRALLDVPDRSTVSDLWRLLGIPSSLSCVCLVDGRDVDPERRLEPGAVVSAFPPLAGGAGPVDRSSH